MKDDMDKERREGREDQAKGMWKQFTGRVREAWGSLTDDDLDRYEGRRDQLIGRIQEKTGEKRAEIAKKIDSLAEDMKYKFTRSAGR